jgi:hypothetical protein
MESKNIFFDKTSLSQTEIIASLDTLENAILIFDLKGEVLFTNNPTNSLTIIQY